MKTKFPLGQVVFTRGAMDALSQPGTSFMLLLARHASGDWGEVDADDKRMNDDAVRNGDRILSAYPINPRKPYGDANKIWLITEADRSSTTFLLPDEY